MAKIIGIGNALVDVLVHIEGEEMLKKLSLAKGGMTLIDEAGLAQVRVACEALDSKIATGGSASNTIHALSVLGHDTGFAGAVGNDAMGDFYEAQMRSRGTEAALLRVASQPTGIATTFITPDGERTFATHLGAASQVSAGSLCALVAAHPEAEILHVEGYLLQNHDLIVDVLSAARAAGLTVSYDLASWNLVEAERDFMEALVRDYVDIVFANEEEAAAFSRQRDPEVALRQLAGVAATAIVKVGARGAIGMHNGEYAAVRGLKHMVVDTTAAGDFFAAGFLHGYVSGASLERCLDYGNHLAGEVIQVYGTEIEAEKLRKAVDI
ncbi:MAG: adenosine kinase [Bacteroidaceae bacterium]|nr:adenosine kinase [Bacteroidaceae bacterium]